MYCWENGATLHICASLRSTSTAGMGHPGVHAADADGDADSSPPSEKNHIRGSHRILAAVPLNIGSSCGHRCQPESFSPAVASSSPDTLLDAAERVVFGHFAAIITMAPLALLWARRRSSSPWQKRLLVPSLVAIALMLALGLCMQLISTNAHSTRTHLVLLAALPAITLTFMHGWRGAAIAIPLLNLPLHFATPAPACRPRSIW